MRASIPLVQPNLPPKEILLRELAATLYSGYIAEGEKVRQFEHKFANYIGNKWTLSFNSGTSALHTALIMAGVKPGDEVISTPVTAEPTNMAIMHTGAKIVWGDVDYETGNLSVESARNKVSPKTRAIVAVHYGGIPVDIARFEQLSRDASIPVVEDAAHALGAKFDGRLIGNHSPYVMFSFQAIKHLTTIDGGMLAVQNENDYATGKLIRWFGIDKQRPRTEVDISLIGYKYHMNNVNATIGIVQLDFVESVIMRHIENGQFFDGALKHIAGVELCKYYEGSEPSYWLYTLKVDKRDDFIRYLDEHGICASVLHPRNDRHKVFEAAKTDLPGVEKFCERMVHIPCGCWVGSEEREYIVETIRRGW
jgi:perosamine synthetase